MKSSVVGDKRLVHLIPKLSRTIGDQFERYCGHMGPQLLRQKLGGRTGYQLRLNQDLKMIVKEVAKNHRQRGECHFGGLVSTKFDSPTWLSCTQQSRDTPSSRTKRLNPETPDPTFPNALPPSLPPSLPPRRRSKRPKRPNPSPPSRQSRTRAAAGCERASRHSPREHSSHKVLLRLGLGAKKVIVELGIR